uniref:Uncharacterized protein n=1 Tax=Physcomitrium patens TaxID=3218 RepID=A0A2K1IE00_PHYPA|nr:hypothetical protein PHYPA_029660 [Physcomitrium patens]
MDSRQYLQILNQAPSRIVAIKVNDPSGSQSLNLEFRWKQGAVEI